jgi:hypothetical protein
MEERVSFSKVEAHHPLLPLVFNRLDCPSPIAVTKAVTQWNQHSASPLLGDLSSTLELEPV